MYKKHFVLRFALGLSLVLLSSPAATAETSGDSDAAALAIGYATAFQQMGEYTVTVLYRQGGEVISIPRIRVITPYDGVLLVRDTKGREQILDATKVVRIVEN